MEKDFNLELEDIMRIVRGLEQSKGFYIKNNICASEVKRIDLLIDKMVKIEKVYKEEGSLSITVGGEE